MSHLRIKDNSPYIYLRYYDSTESNPRKRQKQFSTKLPNNREGWKKARELKKRFDAGLLEKVLQRKRNITLSQRLTFSEGLEDYLKTKSETEPLRPNTERTYRFASDHFLKACGDLLIHHYHESDGKAFTKYLHGTKLSEASKANCTRHLSALFNYFVAQKFCTENIIYRLKAPKGKPESIPFDDMQTILDYFEAKNEKHYHLIYFLLLTGFRISTALYQTWDKIDFSHGVITATNVKAGFKEFLFPLHDELVRLLRIMKPERSGRLFNYSFDRSTPAFWKRGINDMYDKQKISQRYTLHQIRKTFGSWLRTLGVNTTDIQELYNHSDEKITREFYLDVQNEVHTQRGLIERMHFRKLKEVS